VKKHNPAYPFEFHFVKEEYDKGFTGIRSTSRLLWVCGSLAIFISCLGLFGLSAFVAERRTREIGIRKVLGATLADVWFLLSREFFKPLLLAFLLGAPLAGWAMQKLLQNIEYRIGLSWWMFAFTGVLTLLVALLTVSVHGVKTALMNPVKSLRSE
jgi:ABC-type antimicrobial peptide transport system permease subunit